MFHTENLGGQLTALGLATTQLFYESALTLPHISAWGAFENKALVGFVFASYHSSSILRKVILKAPLRWLVHLARTGIQGPKIFFRVLIETMKGVPGPVSPDNAEVHFTAVRSDHRGRGIGQELIKRLRSDLRMHAVPGFTLSVGQRNIEAIHFYERQGGRAIGNYVTAEETMRRFTFEAKD